MKYKTFQKFTLTVQKPNIFHVNTLCTVIIQFHHCRISQQDLAARYAYTVVVISVSIHVAMSLSATTKLCGIGEWTMLSILKATFFKISTSPSYSCNTWRSLLEQSTRKAQPDNRWGFVDRTLRLTCSPGEHHHAMYNGHKRVHLDGLTT